MLLGNISDDIAERLADVMDDDDEDITWGGQFKK